MSLRNRLFKFVFFRSIFTSFGNRTPYSAKTKEFVAYFQYKIGPFQPDYCLYFARQPILQVYKKEIFNKMREYEGYDLIRYLESHYAAYEDKPDFIRFLRYEVTERLKYSIPRTSRLNLQATFDWLVEKQTEQLALQKKMLKAQVQDDVRSALEDQAASGT